ncbi:MAG: glycoside hydrolase family 28 protein [Candidatus Sulfotelmatobacter sp.]
MNLPLQRSIVFAILFSVFASSAVVASTCDPHTYGAKGDSVTKDTAAIQAAIDACATHAGGTIRLSAGTYLIAPIVLKSHVTLQLDRGATLLGSSDHHDYPPKQEFRAPGLQSLVSATDATDVSITGEGVIDGAGQSWWAMAKSTKNAGVMGSDFLRPRLIVFDHCTHVLIEGVPSRIHRCGQLVPYYSDDVRIRNVRILAPADSPNTDAIDPFSSSHVRIDHVFADVGDDNVAIKSGGANSPGPDQPSRDITITDCTFLHGHGLSIGSEIAGGAQNIRARRIHFKGTDNGIRIKANRDRGNDVGPVFIRDVEMINVKNALVLSEYYPKLLPPDHDLAQPLTRLTPHFHDITIDNLTVTESASAGVIIGLPEAPIQRVVLHNIKINATKGLTIGDAEVSESGVIIKTTEGEPLTKLAGSSITVH